MEHRLNDEADLVARVQRGDLQAYEGLVRQHESIAFRTAYLITRDSQDAADVVQDSFVRAFRAIGSFRLDKPFRPWLLRIVTNQSLNRVRASQRRANATQRFIRDASSSEPSPDDALARREQAERLLEALRQLAFDEQILITLRYLLEMPESEVAETLAIPLGTVKSRLHRTLGNLRKVIQRDFADLEELTIE